MKPSSHRPRYCSFSLLLFALQLVSSVITSACSSNSSRRLIVIDDGADAATDGFQVSKPVTPPSNCCPGDEVGGPGDGGTSLFGGVRAISYGGYRAGQSPSTGIHPTHEQIEEDLLILNEHWKLIRQYNTGPQAVRVLEVIRSNKAIKLKVMLGAWLAPEPRGRAANRQQVQKVIQLANDHPDIVVAVSVGNEALVDWSVHRIDDVDLVIQYAREVRDAVSVPVTVADNYAVWLTEDGKALAQHLDFVTVHTYAQWENHPIDSAMDHTIRTFQSVESAIPDKPIILGEVGWTTMSNNTEFMQRSYANEYFQKVYYDNLMAWADQNHVTCFVFEAFDEPWKGGGNMADPEKHWGLFTVNRFAKYAMYDLFPQRLPPEADRVTGAPKE